jgi:hypothetical protein
MPRGPKGEKRPADVIGNAVHVMRIATGEVEETEAKDRPKASTQVKLGASQGGKARSENLSAERRSEIARKAAIKRWEK